MNKQFKDIIAQKTISLEEFSQDFSEERKNRIAARVRYNEVLGELKFLRKKLGITQIELARKADIPRTTITKIESGNYNPTVLTLVRLATALGKKLNMQLL